MSLPKRQAGSTMFEKKTNAFFGKVQAYEGGGHISGLSLIGSPFNYQGRLTTAATQHPIIGASRPALQRCGHHAVTAM